MTSARWISAIVLLTLALTPAARAQDFPTLTGTHPVLVSVDDLPIGAGSLHTDPAERERITRGSWRFSPGTTSPRPAWSPGATWAPARRSCSTCGSRPATSWATTRTSTPDYATTPSEAYIADLEKGRTALQGFLTRAARRSATSASLSCARATRSRSCAPCASSLAKTGQRTLPVTIDDQDWSFEQPWVEARKAGDTARLTRLGEDYQHALRLRC